MAKKIMDRTTLNQITSLLVTYCDLNTPAARLFFLNKCGLSEFTAIVDINTAPVIFAQNLIFESQKRGWIAVEKEYAINLILNELTIALEGHPKYASYIQEISTRFSQDANTVSMSLPDANVIKAKTWWNQKYIILLGSVIFILIIFVANPLLEALFFHNISKFNPNIVSPPPRSSNESNQFPNPDSAEFVALPPLDMETEIGAWLLEVSYEDVDLNEARKALLNNRYITSIRDWSIDYDLTGDGHAEWVIFYSPPADMCSSMYIIEPVTNTMLEDTKYFSSFIEAPIILDIKDITGDGYNDILFETIPCGTPKLVYSLWSLEGGNIQTGQDVAYLRLLQANDQFRKLNYLSATSTYEGITDSQTLISTGWYHSDIRELSAIKTFAAARSVITYMITDGTMDAPYIKGYENAREALDSLFSEDHPYYNALLNMISTYEVTADLDAACVTFYATFPESSQIYSFYDLSDVFPTWESICPS